MLTNFSQFKQISILISVRKYQLMFTNVTNIKNCYQSCEMLTNVTKGYQMVTNVKKFSQC